MIITNNDAGIRRSGGSNVALDKTGTVVKRIVGNRCAVRSSYLYSIHPTMLKRIPRDRRISWYGISRRSIHDDRTDHTLDAVEIITDKFIISSAGTTHAANSDEERRSFIDRRPTANVSIRSSKSTIENGIVGRTINVDHLVSSHSGIDQKRFVGPRRTIAQSTLHVTIGRKIEMTSN